MTNHIPCTTRNSTTNIRQVWQSDACPSGPDKVSTFSHTNVNKDLHSDLHVDNAPTSPTYINKILHKPANTPNSLPTCCPTRKPPSPLPTHFTLSTPDPAQKLTHTKPQHSPAVSPSTITPPATNIDTLISQLEYEQSSTTVA
ncbi:hypothetical protein M758_8G104900 [Ceratodon purpureus]|uniref:Uncharacterized protein n=1 Tax=Ceratodon purpureus TaxID=3225 RepID=A0A8T0H0T3_CERPU|nr:hypothetical protein KC19_8G108400 [Ceratodon purpureus]KAG0608427.1 hypothetical protein M758_8G104900 [Ceratodon purpureus]